MQKKLHFYLLLAFAFWLLPFSAYTQIYPVTISTQLTQPSPIYLSNYANTASTNSPIKVQLTLNDLTIMNRQIRLKCYFQGAVSFATNDFVVGASPIYLEGGVPTLLTNVELGPYFEFQNLQGINPNQYAQPLPEGIYTLSFEVYDFATNKKLSKKSSVTTVIFQNDPPLLNLPANKAGIVEQNIQNVVFSWTPRSINVSNVEYEFSIVEIWNTNTPIQNAFAYSPPLYTTTTRNTTLQYSIAEPQLIPGKTYAWRVKAKALIGAEEIGVFKNNGDSEIYSFKYLTLCNAPIAITTTDVSQDQAKMTWSGAVDNYDYQVNYREKNADSKWYQLITPREYITISNLKPKTTYEYTVGAACDPGEYTHSSVQEFSTMAQDEIAFKGCGIKPDPAALSNQTPLPALFPNDVVTAGDFPIVVLKSTGSNGTFSGEGYVTLPFLEKFKELIDAADALGGEKVNIGKYSRIRITFNNIGINTDFKLISGEIIASYDPNWGSMVDGDKLVNDLMGDTGTVIPIDVQFEIKSIVKNADGTLTITGTNGVVFKQPKTDNDLIITDRNGNQYAVSPNAPVGTIESTGKAASGGVPIPQNTNGIGSGGNITQISSQDVNITFSAGKGFYSLDENPNQDPKLKANTKLNGTYEVIPKKDGSNYYVHYKVISDAPNKEDYVTANATFSNGKTASDIVFKTENGTEIPATWSGNEATLTLKRTLDFAKETILATVKPAETTTNTTPPSGAGGLKYDIAGTLNLWHATGKKVNVTLVGLNGGETPTQSQAQEYLNSIYGKAGIQFEVTTIKTNITDSWGASIETGDSDLLNTYTNGQQTIINDFQTQLGANYKNDTYYVLFTKAPSSKASTLGFMPLKRQFGFVFAPPSVNGGLRTLAHELGHGIFGLQHPFKEYNTTVTTNLLMDYGTGTALNHNDWEIMHAPGLQLYQFTQGDSAGENRTNDGIDLLGNIISKVDIDENKTNTFLAGTLSKEIPYLRVGYNEYSKNDEKLLHRYKGKIIGNKVIYIEETTEKEMPYTIKLVEKGNPIIGELGAACTYSKTTIREWKKSEKTTTEQIINEIKTKLNIQKPKWENISLFKNDPSCEIYNIWENIKTNDQNCSASKINSEIQNLKKYLAKNFTIDKINEIVDEINKNCLGTLKEIDYAVLLKNIKLISSQKKIFKADVPDNSEIAILRLITAIKYDNYKQFFIDLEEKNNELLKVLIEELDDHSIFFWDGNNYNNFIKALSFIQGELIKNDQDYVNKSLFSEDEQLLKQSINLTRQKIKDQPDWDTTPGELVFFRTRNIGKYDKSTGLITIQEVHSASSNGGIEIPSDPIDIATVSPLIPIVFYVGEKGTLLDNINLVLDGVTKISTNTYIAPAIFFKYSADKEQDDDIEKAVVATLDVATMRGGLGTLTKDVSRIKRIWAMMEVAGAIADISLKSNQVSPEITKVVNVYNATMGLIGLKNVALGGYKFVTNLPEATKTLLQENKGLRDLLVAKYIEWRTLIINIDNLSINEKQLVAEQEKVWKVLLQTLPENTYLYNPNMADKIRQVVLNSGESMEKFVNINYKAANGSANADEIIWLQNFVVNYLPKPKLGDVIRKIIPEEDFIKYYRDVNDPVMSRGAGFITKAEDYIIPNSSEELIENLRLDYSGTKFSKDEGFVVIEYKNKSANVEHPFNTTQSTNELPYTNTGMTGSKQNIIPEYYSSEIVKFEEGNVAKVYNKNGKIIENYKIEVDKLTKEKIWKKQ